MPWIGCGVCPVCKTGDENLNKKFDPKVPGTYSAQVQITYPVTAASDPTSVQVTC